MGIHVFALPYDSGQREMRMGRGPEAFLRNQLIDKLYEYGSLAGVSLVETRLEFQTEIATTFELYRKMAVGVRRAGDHGDFPLVLSGNCGAALGAASGLGMEDLAIAWLDSHGDFNTPDTTISGYMDGMALATLTGRCWKKLAESIPGFRALPENRVIHIGGKAFDPAEENLLSESQLTILPANSFVDQPIEGKLIPALSDLTRRTTRIYIHIDLDILDSYHAPANQYSSSGGFTTGQVEEAIHLIAERFTIAGAGVASYDPEYDPQRAGLRAGLQIIECLLGEVK